MRRSPHARIARASASRPAFRVRLGLRIPVACLLPMLVLFLAGGGVASAQANPQPSALIFFRSTSFIGAHVPGESGHRTIVPPLASGSIAWMQLVPGQKRVYWSEQRVVPPSTLVTEYRSARADGADVRAEPDLANARLGPSGQWKYHVDAGTGRYVRSRLDGSEPRDLGFGPPAVWSDRTPFFEDTEQWIYYFAPELSPPPGAPRPRLALLRGNIGTGVVQSVKIFDTSGVAVVRDLRLILDPANARIHLMCGYGSLDDFPVVDSMLYQFDSSTLALIATRGFAEGEGSNPQFALDPATRDYYLTEAGGVSSPQPLRRLRYADLAVFQPRPPIVLDDPAIGLIWQLESHPAIHVPEPAGPLVGWIVVAWVAVLARNRSARRRSTGLA